MQDNDQSLELLSSLHSEPFYQRMRLYLADERDAVEQCILNNTRRNDSDEKLLASYRYDLGRLDVIRCILDEVFLPEIKRNEDEF